MRHFDHLVFGIDANLELCNACGGFLRSLYARDLLNSLGLACTSPETRTWWNYRASSRIDYILKHGPASTFARQGVNEDIAHVLGVDHALVHASIPLLHALPREGRRNHTLCGNWALNLPQAFEACKAFASEHSTLTLTQLQELCRLSSHRPRSFRYVDPPEDKDLARQRKHAEGDRARELAKEVRAALKHFYACKYAEDRLHDSEFALRTVHEHVGKARAPSITIDELCLP